mgnify:CR=1 FL=1|jgi:hypothetical protein
MVVAKRKLKISKDNNLDLVYSWVDTTDPMWQSKYNSYFQSIDKKRHSNHGEIYFSLKTVHKFMPYIRHIFILTDNQKLNHNNIHPTILKKIKYVDHKDIVDKKHLPTFNSTVFEFYLHKIKGLSENFLYSNDDTFVGKHISKKIFFDKQGHLKVHLNKSKANINEFIASKIHENMSFLNWAKNSIKLLLPYIPDPNYMTIHSFYTMNKISNEKAINLIGMKNIEKTFSRKRENINLLPTSFFQIMSVYLGYAKLYSSNEDNIVFKVYYLENIKSAYYAYHKIMKKNHHFFCVNEISNDSLRIYKKIINNYLKSGK